MPLDSSSASSCGHNVVLLYQMLWILELKLGVSLQGLCSVLLQLGGFLVEIGLPELQFGGRGEKGCGMQLGGFCFLEIMRGGLFQKTGLW